MVRLRDLAGSARPPRQAGLRESGRLHDLRYMICGMLCQAPEVRVVCVHGVTGPLRDRAAIESVAGRLAREPRSPFADRAD
jgi:hypothetical protein